MTFAELEAQANRLANVLLGHGAGPGAKVVWCGQNSIRVVVMVNAARKVGVTAVPLNYRLSDEEAAYVTDHCDATIVYVDAELAPMFESDPGRASRRSRTSSSTTATVPDGHGRRRRPDGRGLRPSRSPPRSSPGRR